MKKYYVFLLTLLGTAIGFNVGMKYQAHTSEYIEHSLKVSEQESRADLAIRALTLIHRNSTNTVGFLEINLDTAVAILGSLAAEIPESKRVADNVRMINKAKVFRAHFPYKSNSSLEKSVAHAFSLAEEISRNEISPVNTNQTGKEFPAASPPPDSVFK